ncbi:hypothetical protein DUNSADRAFT_7762 [Dunaliella salina]|uniref:Encoded protein n=1 Tax=Dunaliella salina TaxID=3046 RepID=A0ABQ7GKT4_DUNSA|nr:hypothetical protein DUNSADRAFT_7762 [Dunaliella salina]|eukprot:KAF5835220.1 hypothetical protein DUNSADRAFT_7762 [Dunaliella salina]
MAPDQDHHMAAAVGHLELPPLGSLSCARVAEMHDTLQLGKKAHITYSCPITGYTVPISMELKNTHVVSDPKGSAQELVFSVDLKMSALRADIGHAKMVCPHRNSTSAWLLETAAADRNCACHIYGTEGLALWQSQKLQSDSARFDDRRASADDVALEDTSPPDGRVPTNFQGPSDTYVSTHYNSSHASWLQGFWWETWPVLAGAGSTSTTNKACFIQANVALDPSVGVQQPARACWEESCPGASGRGCVSECQEQLHLHSE